MEKHTTDRHPAVPFAAVAVFLALSACTNGSSAAQETTGSVAPSMSATPVPSAAGDPTVVAQDLDAPWSVTFHEGTALISERDTARILEVTAVGVTREVGVVQGVTPRGEGGLLGIAAHEGELYTYSTASGQNRIVRYDLTGGPGSLSLGASRTVLDGLDAAGYHNGGRIAFGPDGMLYATVGDAGNPSSAQDLQSLSGKVLRLRPDGAVPADNPFPGSPVYSYGHRNPQGIAWDAAGTLYTSEFGQDTWDELNVIEPGGNYGWPEVEGIAGQDGFTDPVQQWDPADASPSGIAVTDGAVQIANLRGERLRRVPLDDLTSSTELFTDRYGRLRDVALAPDGALWLVTSNTDGRGDPADGDDQVIRVPTGS